MRRIIGIVGSSNMPINDDAEEFILKIIKEIPLYDVIVTGDASGVDFLVRTLCIENNRMCSPIYSKEQNFNNGYKKRNQIIADYCDKITSVALPVTKTPCYHCGRDDHERTGGCYTGKLNGNYEVRIFR